MSAELVGAAREGRSDAFALLYTRHAPLVRHILRDYVHDPDDVADLVQEVFARALASLPTLRDPDRFRPWLQSIARNVGREASRLLRRSEATSDAGADQEDREPGPDEMIAFVELVNLVDHAIVELSSRDALAVSMTYLGFTPTDIAAALGLSYGAAKVTLHRARRRLQAALVVALVNEHQISACDEFKSLLGDHGTGSLTGHVAGCDACKSALEALPR